MRPAQSISDEAVAHDVSAEVSLLVLTASLPDSISIARYTIRLGSAAVGPTSARIRRGEAPSRIGFSFPDFNHHMAIR